jgi:hypothetical protein
MNGIVHKLESWLRANSPALRRKGVTVEERIPGPGANVPWKASVGFFYEGVVVSYIVWERDKFETELLVLNSETGRTIVMEDRTVEDISVVDADLQSVTAKLIDRTYLTADPDPKLVIT